MESNPITVIEDWPTLMSVRDVQVLLGSMNIDRRFIQKYAKVTLPLTESLKQPESCLKRKKGTHPARWEWTRQAKVAFQKLKRTFTEALILQPFDPAKQFILQTDVSVFASAGILNKYDGFGVLGLVNYYCVKCSSAKQIYDI